MATNGRFWRWRLSAREVRLLIYFAILLAVVLWKFAPRPWKPTFTLETAHYAIASTAAREQTEEIGRVVEGLYLVYSNLLRDLPAVRQPHPKLRLRLYKDRKEFRRTNPSAGWAEAFYRRPCCHAYYSAAEVNPYHWMLHEAVHQLNAEVAQLKLEQWLDEGLGEYLSTCRIKNNVPVLGTVDPNTYPVWWIEEIATTGGLAADLTNGSIIPLRAIITGRGGPSLDRQFNLYYLHWWTLTHFLFEGGRDRSNCLDLIRSGGGLEAFEKCIGPADETQRDWHGHVGRLKAKLSGEDLRRSLFKQKSSSLATNVVAPR